MNAKKCKTIRRQLREIGVDVRSVVYRRSNRQGTIELKKVEDCGRFLYLRAKRNEGWIDVTRRSMQRVA